MTRNELNVLKANLLGGMNEYIRNINDESVMDSWLALGVPDGADEEELMEIAQDHLFFANICDTFGRLVNYYVYDAEDEHVDEN